MGRRGLSTVTCLFFFSQNVFLFGFCFSSFKTFFPRGSDEYEEDDDEKDEVDRDDEDDDDDDDDDCDDDDDDDCDDDDDDE